MPVHQPACLTYLKKGLIVAKTTVNIEGVIDTATGKLAGISVKGAPAQFYPLTQSGASQAAGELPDLVPPGSVGVHATINGDGVLASAGGGIGDPTTVRAINMQRRSPVVKQRLYGAVSNSGGNYCFGMTRRAPAHFDAIQIVLTGAASAANAFKASIAPTASYGDGYNPTDSAGADITPTLITFGSTDKADFRNPGGGAGTVVVDNASGAGDALIEGRIQSDWIDCRSLDRVDHPDYPPLYHLRLFGQAAPAIAAAEAASNSANPFSAVDPEFYAGYWSPQGTDFTVSKATTGYTATTYFPCVEIKFLLRGRYAYSIGFDGDSIEDGWVSTNAVPQFGGRINGWGRRLVAKLNAAGILASHVNLSTPGAKSQLWHSRAYNSVLSGGLTHLFIKPWSTNEIADGVASVYAALTRTAKLIELCTARRVRPILIRPWAGQSITTAPGILVQAFCDQAKAAGIDVFDAREIMGSGAQLNAQWLTYNSGGAVVDYTHPNDAGQEAVANLAFLQRRDFGLD